MTRASSSRATPPRWRVGADEVADALAQARKAATSRSCAPARAACSGSSRWSRSRRRPAASPTARSTARRRRRRCSTAACSTAARIALRLGAADEIALLQAADAADLRALRHRSIRCRSTTTARMAATRGSTRALTLDAADDRRRGRRRPACAAAAARASRPASSGRPSPTRRPTAEVHRLQRRRGRQRHLRRPHDHGRRSVLLIEGMAIAGIAVGATQGLHLHPLRISARHRALNAAIERRAQPASSATTCAARARVRPRGPRRRRRLCLRRGDRRCSKASRASAAQVRAKPPLPAHQGPVRQADRHQQRAVAGRRAVHPGRGRRRPMRDFGMGRSRGTMPIQLAGNVKHGGLFETAFGITLGELVDDIGGGTRQRPAGARGAGRRAARRLFPARRCSTRRSTTRRSPRATALIGHGGIVVFDDTVDMAQQARFAMEFCAVESCGKCTPCRIGSTRGVETIDKIIARRSDRERESRGRSTISARR